MPGMDRPEQRQIVIAVPCRYRFALLGQRLYTTLVEQKFPYLAPELVVSFLCLRCCQHLTEYLDQGFLNSTMLIMQSLQLLLRQGLSFTDAPQHHLDQFITAAPACLTQHGEQQCMPPAHQGNIAYIADVERGGFSGELAQFCMGDAFHHWIRIDQASQPTEPFDPDSDGCGSRGTGCQLQPVEPGRCAIFRPDQQGIQYRRVLRGHTSGDSIVDMGMNLRSQPIDQPVKSTERWQIYRSKLQYLDRPIDQVGWIAHGFGGFESGSGHQCFSHIAIRRGGEILSDRRLISIKRFGSFHLIEPHGRGQSELRRQMRNGACMNLVRRREVTEILARFQECRQHQASRITPRATANEGEIRLAQRISRIEFFSGQPRTRPRVSRSVDGCHGVQNRGRRNMANCPKRSIVCLLRLAAQPEQRILGPAAGRVQLGQRAALYCRVSTSDQSCARQGRDLSAFAERAGYEVIGTFKETGSGVKLDRAERRKVMALAQARQIDVVLVTELSRWGRSTTDLLATLKELEARRVSVIALNGMAFDLSTPHGRMIATVLAGIAEFERELIQERIRSGIAAAKARGRRLGRQPGQRPKSDRLAPRVLALVDQGRSYRLIGREVGLSKNTVAEIVRRDRARSEGTG